MELTPRMIKDLKAVSDMSSRKGWEYAGKLDLKLKGKKVYYGGITRHTSKKKDHISSDVLKRAWDGSITYHTHPCNIDDGLFYSTLPSNADLRAFIKGFPYLWTNLILDRNGFYIIQLTDIESLPLPNSVETSMDLLRVEPYLWSRRINHEGFEYFHTTFEEWSGYINKELHPQMLDTFGIDVTYHGYDMV